MEPAYLPHPEVRASSEPRRTYSATPIHQPILTTCPVRADSSGGKRRLERRHSIFRRADRRLLSLQSAVGEVGEFLLERSAARALEHRPVGRVGAVELVSIGDAEIWKRILDLDKALGADDVHALVDVVGRLVRHAPDRLQRRRGAAGEAVHRLPDVGMFQAAHIDGLRVGANHTVAGEPEHQVGVVDGVADDRADLVQYRWRPGGGDVAPRGKRHDLTDAAGRYRFLCGAITRIETADMADLQDALRSSWMLR